MADVSITTVLEGVSRARAGLDSLTRALDGLEREARGAGGGADDLNRGVDRAAGGARNAASAFDALRSTLGGLGLGLIGQELIRQADAWANMESRIRLVTDSSAELAATQQKLFQISKQTFSALSPTVDLYTNMDRATKHLGATQEELFTVTKAVNQAIILSGAGAQQAEASLLQLAQAFGEGSLKGDELKSIMSQTPKLAQAIADGLDVPIGKLREMGAQGTLTSQKLLQALIKVSGGLQEEFSSMNTTVANSFVLLKNSVLRFIGLTDQAAGASSSLAQDIISISDAIDSVTPKAEAFGSALSGSLEPTKQLSEEFKFLATSLLAVAGTVEIVVESIKGGIESLLNPVQLLSGTIAAGILAAQGKFEEAGRTLMRAGKDVLTGIGEIGQGVSQTVGDTAIEYAEKIREIWDRASRETASNVSEAAQAQFRRLSAQIDEAKAQYREYHKELALVSEQQGASSASAQKLREKLTAAGETISSLSQKLSSLKQEQSQSTTAMDAHVKAWRKAQAAIEEQREETKKTAAAYKELKSDLEFQISLLGKTAEEVATLTAVRKLGTKATDDQKKKIKELVAVLIDGQKAQEKQTKAAEEWRREAEEAKRTRIDLRKEVEETQRAQENFMESLRTETRLMKLSANEREVQVALLKAHALGIHDMDDEIRRLITTQQKLRESTKKLGGEAQEVFSNMPNFAQSAADGIQRAFADTFKDIFSDTPSGFKGLFDRISDLFQDLLSEMAGAWAASGLFKFLGGGGAKGGGGFSVGSLFNGSFLSGETGDQAALSLSRLGLDVGTSSSIVSGLSKTAESIPELAAAAFATSEIGKGFAGLFGFDSKSEQMGASIAGMLTGGLLGPLGGWIGGLFGGDPRAKAQLMTTGGDTSGFKKGLFAQTPFGTVGVAEAGSKALDKVQDGLTQFIVTSTQKFDKTLAAFMTTEQQQSVADDLKGTKGFRINIGKKFEEGELAQAFAHRAAKIITSLGGEIPALIKKAMASEDVSISDVTTSAIKEIIVLTNELGGGFEALLRAAEGTPEEIAQMGASLASLNDFVKEDPFAEFQTAWENSQLTLTQRLAEQRQGIVDLALAYDGSLQSTQALASATASYRQGLMALLSQIQQVQAGINQSFGSTADRIKFAALQTDEEKRKFFSDQVISAQDRLRGFGPGADPLAIQRAAERARENIEKLYMSLSPEDRAARRDDFLKNLQLTNELAQKKLEEARAALKEQNEELGNIIKTSMDGAAGTIEGAAAKIDAAAGRMAAAGLKLSNVDNSPISVSGLMVANESSMRWLAKEIGGALKHQRALEAL